MELTKEKIFAVALISVIVLSAIVFLFFPNILKPRSILAVSSIEVAAQGGEDSVTGEWTGSFWNILMITDMNDMVGAYKFDDSEAEKGEDMVDGKKLVPQSEILLKIFPEQPYYERPLERKAYMVYPKTYGKYQNKLGLSSGQLRGNYVEELSVATYQWSEGYWTKHTPFRVEVYKNGALIGQENINTVGGTETITIRNPSDSSEWLSIKNLGAIDTGRYGEPDYGGNIVLFSKDEVYRYSDDLLNAIKYDNVERDNAYQNPQSYNQYWFGGDFWSDDSPEPPSSEGSVNTKNYPGWYRNDDTLHYRWYPIAGSIFETNTDTTPQGRSLISYLDWRGFSTVDLDVWHQGVEIIDDNVRVYMPHNSMSSLITVQISTEFADTIVYMPPVANLEIIEIGNLEDAEIGDRRSAYVRVKQLSTVESTGALWLEIEPSGMTVNPSRLGVNLKPNRVGVYDFEVINSGLDKKTKFTLTVTAENELGEVTDEKSVSFYGLPKGVGASRLTVYTIDHETREPVGGIPVTVIYDSTSDTDYTDEGSVTFDLEGVTGKVTVSSSATQTYRAATTTKEVSEGLNEVTLELYKHGEAEEEEGFPDWVLWLTLGCVVAVIVVAVVVYAHRRR